MTEENGIIKAVLNGDTESFRLLVERYEKPVTRMIGNLINDRHICEDIAQEVFLAAYRKLGSFDPARSSFSTWLFTIARNRSINAMKKRRAASVGRPPERMNSTGPADAIEQDELYARLDAALNALVPRHRRALVLAEFEDLSYEKIAQIEGVRVGTVKSRINRAKKKLRSALGSPDGVVL
ncbi:MAG: sigma-70 family RNA polymerase sigma factor [Phycisphaerales bacterium]|nr:MAG: sigma-70 family RNA polymerase sigma factor [Phycisphaerales bacterium]